VNLISSTEADQVIGLWLTEEKDGKIEIYKVGNAYHGKIVWGNDMKEADEKTLKKDVKNPDPKLRQRTLQDLPLLSGFVYRNGVWEDGKIYDPQTGKTYSCTMKYKSGKLEIRGFIGISLFGRSTYWTKISAYSGWFISYWAIKIVLSNCFLGVYMLMIFE
jgi:uncharacterized protein (DUF2147 family)